MDWRKFLVKGKIADIDCGNGYYISLRARDGYTQDERTKKAAIDTWKHPGQPIRKYEVIACHKDPENRSILWDAMSPDANPEHVRENGVCVEHIEGDAKTLDEQLIKLARKFETADITIPQDKIRAAIEKDMAQHKKVYLSHFPDR